MWKAIYGSGRFQVAHYWAKPFHQYDDKKYAALCGGPDDVYGNELEPAHQENRYCPECMNRLGNNGLAII